MERQWLPGKSYLDPAIIRELNRSKNEKTENGE